MPPDYTVGDRTLAFPSQPPEGTDYDDFTLGTEVIYTARSGGTQQYADNTIPSGTDPAYFVNG